MDHLFINIPSLNSHREYAFPFTFWTKKQVSAVSNFKRCWYVNVAKSLIGSQSYPIDSNGPGLQLAMWLCMEETMGSVLCMLCYSL